VPYRHVVLFRVYDEVTDEQYRQLADGLRSLGSSPGILEWRVEESLDQRKGRVLIEESTFESAEAVEVFRHLPAHQEVSALLAQSADWLVGDYEA
jgi:hypothetical protein